MLQYYFFFQEARSLFDEGKQKEKERHELMHIFSFVLLHDYIKKKTKNDAMRSEEEM